MADQQRSDPITDFFSLAAGPIAAVIRSFDQLRKGSDELMRGMQNFNDTMETLNDTAQRVNALLNEFEEPIRTLLPQITRTLKTADAITTRLAGPVEDVAPGLERLAHTLNSPVLAALPTDLGAFLDAINDLVKRMAPLSQLADSAGGLFGLRLPGLSRPATSAATPSATAPTTSERAAATTAVDRDGPSAQQRAAERAAAGAQTVPARKPAAKKTAAKKTAAKKPAAAKKSAARESAAK